MKNLCFIYIIGLFLLLVSCRNVTDEKLRVVSNLRSVDPDSALLMLEAGFPKSRMSSKQLSEWCLLEARLLDTLRKNMELDTLLMLRSVDYFQRNKAYSEMIQASLYLGRAYAFYHSYMNAAASYKMALEKAIGLKSFNQAGYVSSYLGDLYDLEGNYPEALELYTQSSHYFLKANNMRSHALALRDMGSTYDVMEKFDQAVELYDRADSVITELGDAYFISSMASHLGITFLNQGKYDKANDYLLRSIEMDSTDNLGSYMALSMIYLEQKDIMKYKECMSLVEQYDKKSIYDQAGIYYGQYLYFQMLNDYKNALHSLEHFSDYQDSIKNYELSIRALEAAKKYQYSQLESENALLTSRSEFRLLGILFLCLLVLCIYFVFRQILEKQKFIKKEQEMQLKEQVFLLYEKEIEIKKQEEKFDQLRQKEYVAKQALLTRSLLFKKVRMLSELRTSNPCAFQSEVEAILISSSLSEEEWEAIKNEIDFVYIGFTGKLIVAIPKLSEDEIRFCCLLKVGLDTSELATLLDINPASVDRKRTRINKKIKELYPDMEWRSFLNTF